MTNKEVCPECGRYLRKKWFTTNPIKNKRMCVRCDKKIGHNQFYAPIIKGVKIQSRKPFGYGITEDENNVLFQKKCRGGGNASESIKFLKHYINKFYQKKRYEEKNEKINNKEKQENFIKGLK